MTWLLKKYIDLLFQPITAIINRSLAEGLMPSSIKYATLTPLLMTTGKEEEGTSTYGPTLNSPFLSNLRQKVVAGRIEHYILIYDFSLHVAKITQHRQRHF